MNDTTEFICPRRTQALQQDPPPNTWSSSAGLSGGIGPSCSGCGSLHPDVFMEHVRNGWIVEPTDKGYKCQPAGTLVRVATGQQGPRPFAWEDRPIEEIRPGDQVVTYSRGNCQFFSSGREVLKAGVRPYSGELIRVNTPLGSTRYTPERICVVRLAGGLLGHQVYLMRRGTSFRIGRARGWSSSQKTAGVSYRASRERADAFWILASFATAQEAVLHEAITSWRYGIPDQTFVEGNKSTLLNQSLLDQFWASAGDLTDAAKSVLNDHGRDPQLPLWERDKVGTRFWRTRTVLINACNLLDGMEMLDAAGTSLPITASRESYTGNVYSLAVDKEETYIADGVVTHNCYLDKPYTAEELERIKTGDAIWKAARQLKLDEGATADEATAAADEHWNKYEAPERKGRTVAKFYYQHLSAEQRAEFIELHNTDAMKLAYPGYFYVRPFFTGVPGAEAADDA